MEAAGFRPGRCCRSLQLRKQSRGTRQTVPPGYGSQASCEAVRSIHQLQPRYTQQRKSQRTRPSERRFETARCDVRFGDVPTRCRDAQSRLHSPSSRPDWDYPEFCVTAKMRCKIELIFQGGSGADFARLVYNITPTGAEVKGHPRPLGSRRRRSAP